MIGGAGVPASVLIGGVGGGTREATPVVGGHLVRHARCGISLDQPGVEPGRPMAGNDACTARKSRTRPGGIFARPSGRYPHRVPTSADAPTNAEPDSRPRRLHPLSLIFRFATHVRNLLIPGLIVLFLAREREGWEIWLMAMFVPSIVFELFTYFTLHYRLARTEIIINRGLLFRSERHIPFARIQNIDLTQNLFHRLLGLAEVRLDTGGGNEPEAVLKVITLGAVDEIRARIFAGRELRTGLSSAAAHVTTLPQPQSPGGAVSESPVQPAIVLHRLTPRELVKLGVVANRGIALVAVAVGAAWEYDLFERIRVREYLENSLRSLDWAGGVLISAVVVVAAVISLTLLSVIWSVLRFWGYTLEQRGDDLRVQCGLFTRRAATVPRHRVQFVSVQEGLFHRVFRRVSIRIETAGGAKDEDDTVSGRWFVPLVPRDDASRVLREIHPAFDVLQPAAWRPVHPRGLRRLLFSHIVGWLAVAGAFSLVFRPWGLAAIPVLTGFAVWVARREYRFMRYAMGDGSVLFRSGALRRKWSATIIEKVQAVTVRESPFDRWHGHVSLAVDTAGAGPADHRIHVPYLDAGTGHAMRREIATRTGRSAFRW